jgi:hypothetical protein
MEIGDRPLEHKDPLPYAGAIILAVPARNDRLGRTESC